MSKDVKNELEATLGILSGKGKGVKGKGPRGSERKKMWEEVKALRKEYPPVFSDIAYSTTFYPQISSTRKRDSYLGIKRV